jgi:hypothetical protein
LSRSVPRPTLGAVVGGILALAGFVLGARALGDNSFLTHLATGRLILDTGSVPSADPYTFTAQGEPWVVQSWLVSVLYATAEEVGGATGIRILVGLLAAGLVGVLWALARPAAGLLVRMGLVGLALGLGGEQWSERPLLVGLLLLASSILVVERSWSPWLLVPIGWVWANSHGSFPLGLVLLALLAVGRRLDEGRWGPEPRYVGTLALGVLAGAVGPLGLGALLFPVQLLTGNETLASVTEWRSPTFEGISQRLFLVQIVVAVALLVRRPSWRVGLPMAVFVVAALLSSRNIAVASVVLIPAMAAAAPAVGRLRAETRSPIAWTLAVVLLAVTPVMVLGRLGQQDYRLDGRYPLRPLAWADDRDIGPDDLRLATQDFSGNLIDLLWGGDGLTFFDDRFDMFPRQVAQDYLELSQGGPGWSAVLEGYGVDAVVWRRDRPLAHLLVSDPFWSVAYADEGWVLATRRP